MDNNISNEDQIRNAIAETANALLQTFPSREEAIRIGKESVPAELRHLDVGFGDKGGCVLRRGQVPLQSNGVVSTADAPTSFWGKAVLALKSAATYLTGNVEIKASTGIEITPVATPGSESLTFKNTGVTSITGVASIGSLRITGDAIINEGVGIALTGASKTITINNDGVRTLTAGDNGISFSTSKGDVVALTDPARRLPNGYLVTNLYFAPAGESQVNLVADGVGVGAFTGQTQSGYVVPGGPVGGSGGGGGSGFSGTQTTYGQAYISGTNLVQNVIVWTFSNGLLQSVTPSGTNTIATLLSCDT